jgi:hypothetical protein
MDIYAQFVPAAQRRAVAQMMDMVTARMAKASPASVSVNRNRDRIVTSLAACK